jgi:hypothetical protein
MRDTSPRLGAYILPGDPTWLRSSLSRYYPLLETLVVPIPDRHLSWTGEPLPVDICLDIVRDVDVRGILRTCSGTWVAPKQPLEAEKAQRQAAMAELGGVDWVLQIDNDELMPEQEHLLEHLKLADAAGLPAVEWPMRVLFRRLTSRRYLEVVGHSGRPRYDYPGPIAIRQDVRPVEARRTHGPFLRPVVVGDRESLQIVRAPDSLENRVETLKPEQVILHNSWARQPKDVWRKVRSSGHYDGLRTISYYWAVWRLAPLTWRYLHNFHLIHGPLWPKLAVLDKSLAEHLILPSDRT